MTATFVSDPNFPQAKALSILLEAREGLGDLCDWGEIDKVDGPDDRAPIAAAYHAVDRTIENLGGPSHQTIYDVMHEVLGNVPGTIEDEPAIAAAILGHCASVAAASK